MAADLLDALMRISLAASAGVLLVMVLRPAVRGRFGARAAYGLWAVPACMALAAVLPGRLADAPAQAGWLDEGFGLPLLIGWGIGTLAVLIVTLAVQVRFLRALGKPKLDAGGLPILRTAESKSLGPAVVGVISPKIVLPADFEQRYSASEQALVLAHERSHLFGHDAKAIALMMGARALNWFNPLAYLAAHALRVDQELACDAVVMEQYPKARRSYAEALAKTQLAEAGPPLGCQWPARGPGPLERRIAALETRTVATPPWGVALVVGLAMLASAAAWAMPTPSLVRRPPVELRYWAMLKDDVSLLLKIRPKSVRSGEAIERSYEVREGVYYDVTLTPVLQRSGDISVTAVVSDGQERRRQTLALEPGEPRIIKVGTRNLLIAFQR